jgi:hypothetical protein
MSASGDRALDITSTSPIHLPGARDLMLFREEYLLMNQERTHGEAAGRTATVSLSIPEKGPIKFVGGGEGIIRRSP